MLVSNKISKTLEGPYRFIGIYFVVVGIMSLFEQAWIIFSIHAILGWFLLGSYSGIDIDTKKQQFRNINMWFGLIKTGKWESVHKYIGLTLVSMNKVYSLYSRSNLRRRNGGEGEDKRFGIPDVESFVTRHFSQQINRNVGTLMKRIFWTNANLFQRHFNRLR